MTSTALFIALALCVAGPIALRLGWQRAMWTVASGWAMLAWAAVMLVRGEGAWGLALGASCAMACALFIVAQAGVVTPGPVRPIKDRPGRQLSPPSFDFRDFVRRVGVFLIVVVLDLVASVMLAWAFQRGLLHLGVLEANAVSTGIFVLPIVWIALASWQMTMVKPLSMIVAAFGTGLTGVITWLVL